jgi:uncharacterized protein (DUF2384 family)
MEKDKMRAKTKREKTVDVSSKSKYTRKQTEFVQVIEIPQMFSYFQNTAGVFDLLYSKEDDNLIYPMFRSLSELTKLPVKTLAELVFEITPKTFNNYRLKGNNVPMRIRELSVKLVELYSKGNRLFGSVDNFNKWLQKESYGLGGLKPINLINSVTGIETIDDELTCIQYGTTA